MNPFSSFSSSSFPSLCPVAGESNFDSKLDPSKFGYRYWFNHYLSSFPGLASLASLSCLSNLERPDNLNLSNNLDTSTDLNNLLSLALANIGKSNIINSSSFNLYTHRDRDRDRDKDKSNPSNITTKDNDNDDGTNSDPTIKNLDPLLSSSNSMSVFVGYKKGVFSCEDSLSDEAKASISNGDIFFNFHPAKAGTSHANTSYITRISAIDLFLIDLSLIDLSVNDLSVNDLSVNDLSLIDLVKDNFFTLNYPSFLFPNILDDDLDINIPYHLDIHSHLDFSSLLDLTHQIDSSIPLTNLQDYYQMNVDFPSVSNVSSSLPKSFHQFLFDFRHFFHTSFRLAEFNRQEELELLDLHYHLHQLDFKQHNSNHHQEQEQLQQQPLELHQQDQHQEQQFNHYQHQEQDQEQQQQFDQSSLSDSTSSSTSSTSTSVAYKQRNKDKLPKLSKLPRTYYQIKVSFPAKVPTNVAHSLIKSYLQQNFSNSRLEL